MKKISVTIAAAAMLALAGCASGPKSQAPMAGTQGGAAAASTAGAQTAGTGAGQPLAGQPKPQSGPQSSYENRVIYFDFDKSVVKPAYFPLLKRQAAYLSAHPDAKVLLEGYTDDRGTWEYNIGLGSRRAAAVRRYLLLQGVNDGQIKTISYGEAYPADPQDNEAAWAKNRRVVIKYEGQAPGGQG